MRRRRGLRQEVIFMVKGLPDAMRMVFDDERVVPTRGSWQRRCSLIGLGSRRWSMRLSISGIDPKRPMQGGR
jgi:hypothetical protein